LAYEVTKRIKGRDYRYRVEAERDPETGRTRTRWRYLGRIDGDRVIAPARTLAPRVTREHLVVATATLLRTRDLSRITVAVIAHHAGISTGTFYRHFPDRRSALDAARRYLLDEMLRDLPSLAGRVGTPNEERDRLYAWFVALQGAALHGRAFRALLSRAGRDDEKERLDESPAAAALRSMLATYLRRLDDAGCACIADPDALAGALLRLNLSFVRDMSLAADPSGAPLRWSEVFPVVERAVFPHRTAA
jgi:AcrR family transcriptional regulator